MPKFSSLNEFRSWANKYDISIKEEYEFNENVKKVILLNSLMRKMGLLNLLILLLFIFLMVHQLLFQTLLEKVKGILKPLVLNLI